MIARTKLGILVIYGAALCLGSSSTNAVEASGEILTLAQAKQVAIERNAILRGVKDKLESARSREGRAASPFYPTLETKIGSEQGLSGSTNSADSRSTFSYLLGRWNIYRGGRDVSGKKIATIEAQIAELEVERKRIAIESEVELVFSNLLFYRDVTHIKERFIELNSKQQSLARQLVSRGNGSHADTVAFDLRDFALRSELLQIQQSYKGELVRLKFLLGEDIAKNPSPTGELPHLHVDGALADYANQNLELAPDVKAAALSLDSAQHKLALSRSRWLPQVDVEGKVGALPPSDGGEKDRIGSSIALVATWEIFGGFDSMYESRERTSDKSAADWQLKSDIHTILADIESRFGELLTIQTRADLGKDNVQTAHRYYDLVFEDFKRGYKNSGDLNSAAQTWYDAEVQRKQLDLDFVQKKLELELKIGKNVATKAMKDVTPSGSQGGVP